MAKIIFSKDNFADSGTLTSSSEAAGFPKENVRDYLFIRHWRSTGDSDEWLKWDFGAAKQPTVLFVRYQNAQAAGVVKIQGNATDVWTAPSVNLTITNASDSQRILFKRITSSAYQWWRLHFADATNPDTFIKVGRVFLGDFFQPTFNYIVPQPKTLVEPSDIVYSKGGQAFVDEKTPYKIWGYNFPKTIEADADEFENLKENYWKKRPLFICEDEDDSTPYDRCSYVRCMNDFEITRLYDTTFAVGPIEFQQER